MTTILRIVLIVAGAALLGLTGNALRRQDHIDLSRAYFKAAPAQPVDSGTGDVEARQSGALDTSRGGAAGDRAADVTGSGETVDHEPPRHPFHPVSTDEARDLHEQARDLPGFVIFVDARPDDEYHAGHIPGAYPLDYYNITNLAEGRLRTVLDAIEIAHEVVVYCNGGDCEDSLLLCTELRDSYFVPVEKLYLYEGGMEEWKAADLPVEQGDRRDVGEDG